MKIFNYILAASLVFALTSKAEKPQFSKAPVALVIVQEIEPELEQFLADNPDILSATLKNQQDKPSASQVITDKSGGNQVNAKEVVSAQDSFGNTESGTNAELEDQLQVITEEFDSIFDKYLFLNQSTSLNQTELSTLKLYVNNEIAKVKKLTSLGDIGVANAPWYTQRLREIIYWFKFACLNLEALSVSSEDSKLSMLKEPLDFVEMQHAKLAILDCLFDLYNPSLKKGPVPLMWVEYSEKSVRSIIFESLPDRLQSSIIQYILCGITLSSAQAYYLSKILSQNFYEKNIVLSEEYFEIISIFYTTQKLGGQFDIDAFINKTEDIINAFATNRNSSRTSCKNSNSNLVLELLLTKLIKIKNDVVKFYKPNLNFKDNQEKAKLLIRYKLLIENKKFELLFTNKQFCAFFDLYCNFLQDFFANKIQPQVADLRLFEVECMLADLIIMIKGKLKQDVAPSKIELAKQLLLKYALELDAKEPMITTLVDMGKILETARDLINKDLKIDKKGFFANIRDAIFSGNWIDSEKIKGMGTGTSQTVVDFLEYAFDRKFENFKEAAFFLLAKTSPVLAAGLIYKVMPYLSGNLQEKASKLIGDTELDEANQSTQKETDYPADGTISQDTPDNNKIFDFVSKNPEIFNRLCEVKPNLINGLADIVERRLIKAKS